MLKYLALDLVAVADARQREAAGRAARPRRFGRRRPRATAALVPAVTATTTVVADLHGPKVAIEATLS